MSLPIITTTILASKHRLGEEEEEEVEQEQEAEVNYPPLSGNPPAPPPPPQVGRGKKEADHAGIVVAQRHGQGQTWPCNPQPIARSTSIEWDQRDLLKHKRAPKVFEEEHKRRSMELREMYKKKQKEKMELVKLNIGGWRYTTTKATLTRFPASFFTALLVLTHP